MSKPRSEVASPIDSETLFRRYAGFVAAFLHRLGTPETDLDDLVQDVFMTAHRRGGYLPGAASPTTFLARLALEVRLASRRRSTRWRQAHSETLATQTIGVQAATPEHSLSTLQAAHRLQQALDAIEPGRRAVFVLFELEGESCEAIAAGLDLKLGTVYSRLHAARRAFREHVARSERRDSHPARRDPRKPS